MITRKLYQWHRKISLIIAIPVLLWALSGFLHPIMTNIRPKVVSQVLWPTPIDSTQIQVPLETALRQNRIDSFYAFRIVSIAGNWFYQVQEMRDKEPVYLATLTGKPLASGNWLYAQWLARRFLEGDGVKTQTAPPSNDGHDCCDAATSSVLGGSKGAPVTDASLVRSYNSEYKPVNRLLPVYRVSFARKDGIRVYVDPTTDRFALAMDNKRYVFDRIFTIVHTWGWLDFMGQGKLLIEFLLSSLIFLNALMGIYLFFKTKSKKATQSARSKARRNHRYTAIVITLFTLMFSFSGAWHALAKMDTDDRDSYYVDCRIAASDTHLSFNAIAASVNKPVTDIGIAHLNNDHYWRVQVLQQPSRKTTGDLMRSSTPPTSALYLSPVDLSILNNGDEKYARYLAHVFSAHDEGPATAEHITRFGAGYNFADKRLPVWKIEYSTHHHERFFIETATSTVAKHTTNTGLWQEYSFAFLHKHEFLSRAGKTWKDFSTLFWSLAQVVLVAVGLGLYWRIKN